MTRRTTQIGQRTKAAAQAVAFVLCVGSLLVILPGCRNCDLVEAELRGRDAELRELREELHRMGLGNDALQREMRALRRNSPSKVPPEDATLIFSLKSISLGRQTGGYDDDDCPGAEALQIVLEPRDVDNHVIKAQGTMEIRVMEVSEEGLKTPLCSWHIPPEKLRRTWKSGLLSTGYFVTLPWKAWPSSESLRVAVSFTLADGRRFEADKDVTLRLTPAARRKSTPTVPSDPFLGPDPIPAEQAPLPRRIEGGTVGTGGRSLPSAVQVLSPQPRRP